MIKYLVFFSFIISNGLLFSKNIMISNQNAPNEPSIMIDPKHPNVILAGANINNYFISVDTGKTWSVNTLKSTYGVWGDPTFAVDTASNFLFFHLSNPVEGSWIDRIVCQKTTDNGTTWNNGSYTGLSGTKAQDKQWCAIDKKNNNIYLTWTQFDKYGSSLLTDSSYILFSKSIDAGESWSEPLRLNTVAGDCIDSDNTVEGAVPCVGPNGEVYVCWAGPEGLLFTKSTDKGETWLKNEIWVDSIPGGWNYLVGGLSRCNGLPIIECDLSNGPNKGNIYINWSDQRNGENDTDIWFTKSTDGGVTWSKTKRVNDDNTKTQQFLTWMTIDQTNGYIYFVFYDRRDYENDSTDVYLALSINGGETFINQKISESPFLPFSSVFFGDYTNISVHNGIIRPIWTRLNNGQLSIWTDLSTINIFSSIADYSPINEKVYEFENYPNPANNYTFVSYKLRQSSIINLKLISMDGNIIKSILSNEPQGYGKYVERIDLTSLELKSGVYYLKLDIDNITETMKMIIIK